MAANYITPPTTPSSCHTPERRSIDSEILSQLASNEGRYEVRRVTAGKQEARLLKIFNTTSNTYNLENAHILGSGLWSTVYLVESRPLVSTPFADITPPSTPPRLSLDLATAKPKLLAVKIPARGDAQDVLATEAQILSHLTADPTSKAHIVPFHGLDERNGGLVMDAIPQTLDAFSKRLEELSEDARRERMTRHLPRIARCLVEGLAWLHLKGIVHGDIKPSNILMRQQSSSSSENITEMASIDLNAQEIAPVYCDFSASLPISPNDTNADPSFGTPSKTIGGGTWEYLAPELLILGSPDPTPSSDVYALGITLLTFLLGVSPFATMTGNRYMLRNAIKTGEPLRFANDGELKYVRRLAGWEAWLRPVLAKKPEARLTAEEWLAQLQKEKL